MSGFWSAFQNNWILGPWKRLKLTHVESRDSILQLVGGPVKNGGLPSTETVLLGAIVLCLVADRLTLLPFQPFPS